MTKPFTF